MIEFVAKAFLPTKFGDFEVLAFREKEKEHLALISGPVEDGMAVRIHSKCLTGDTLGSLRCDCHEQLELSLAYLNRHGGILIYLDQEGRGIGLANKIKAYALQDKGLDTVEANKKLGFKDDIRVFDPAVEILSYIGIRKIRLLTNNPKKIKELEAHGISVERIPLVTPPTKYNRKYLDTKKEKMNHMIE